MKIKFELIIIVFMEDSKMLKMLKEKNPTKEYPQKVGAQWSEEEKEQLMKEFGEGVDLKTIASNHQRTAGSIIARRKTIAATMHKKDGLSVEEVMKKLNMTSAEVNAALNKKKIPKKSDKSMSATALIENLRKQMNEMKSMN